MRPSMRFGRSRLVLFFLLLILALCPTAARAGSGLWTNQGPDGGFLSGVTIDPGTPSTLYVADSNVLYKSTDRGATWAVHTTTFPTGSGAFLRINPLDPSIFYMGTGRLLHRSVDGGVTWSVRSELPILGNSLAAFEIDPLHPSTLYMAPLFYGFFKSTDGGATWSPINDGLATFNDEIYTYFLGVARSNPELLFGAGYDENFEPVVYKSTDGGLHWSRTAMVLSEDLLGIEVDPQNPSIVYALGLGRLYKSVDGGVSWAQLDPFLHFYSLAVDPSHPSTLWAGNEAGTLYKSTDGGVSWVPASEGLAGADVQRAVAIDPESSSNLYASAGAGHPAGIYRSSDGGVTWSPANTGLRAQNVLSIAASPSDPARVYAGTSVSGVFTSADGGRSWQPLAPLIKTYDSGPQTVRRVLGLAVHPSDPLTVWAATRAGVFKSTDGGESWSESDADLFTLFRLVAIDPQNPAVVYAGAERGNSRPTLSKSIDGGESFSPIGDFRSEVLAVAIDPLTPSTLFVSVEYDGSLESDGINRSTDGGATWSNIEIGPERSSIAALAIDPQDSAVVYAASASGYGIFKSTDGGDSWLTVNNGLGHGIFHSLVLDPANPSTLYAAAPTGFFDAAAVYRSVNGGAHWTLYTSGLEALDLQYDVTALAVSAPERSALYGATEVGVWAYEQVTPCTPGAQTLCLGEAGERFEVTLHYDTVLGGGREGEAGAIPLDTLGVSDGGILWFFEATNPEVLVKVLDGCRINDRYWVFYAATTTAGFTLRVRDRLTGLEKVYTNPDETSAVPVADTNAFTGCPNGGVVAPPPDRVLGVPPSGASVSLREAAKGEIGGSCVADPETLCIDGRPGDRRFRVKLHYDTVLGGGREGEAGAIPLTPAGVTRGGILWFFERDNPEVLVKVLDGCATNGHYWLFYAATTTAGFTLTVEDTASGAVLELTNPDETSAVPVSQIEAFGGCEL